MVRRWAGLGLGLVLMAFAVAALHHTSASVGDVMGRSQTLGLESDAYFYTEVGDVGEFVESEGRYRGKRGELGR